MKIVSWPLKIKKRPFSRFYLSILLYVVRKALQGMYKYDAYSKEQLEQLGSDFSLGLTASDAGPSFILQITEDKNKKSFKYLGTFKKLPGFKPDLKVQLKSIGSAMQIFTFAESVAQGEANSRFIADGPLEAACTFVRILERTEIILLPRFIAKRAVKRYASFKNLTKLRAQLYSKVIFG